MSQCNIDHSFNDVLEKLQSQKEYLPAELFVKLQDFVKKDHAQETLNELFHLLKKYDLTASDEQAERNSQLEKLIR